MPQNGARQGNCVAIMKFNFTAKIHEDFGELGWRDSRISYYSPYGPISPGIGFAHDCLEHFALNDVKDEIMAHAAIYWGRFQGGYCNSFGRHLDLSDIASEWISLYDAMRSDHSLIIPPRTIKINDIEDDITEIIRQGSKILRENFDEDEYESKIAKQIEVAFCGWFRLGYRKAENHYRKNWGWDPCTFSHYFKYLSEKSEKFKPEYEGEQLTVTITKDGSMILERTQIEAEILARFHIYS